MKGKIAHVPSREGAFAVDTSAVISTLQCYLEAKYSLEIAYRSYADRVKGPWRDSLVSHWYEHAKDEKKSQYDLAMKIIGLGGDPAVCSITIPNCTYGLQSFFMCLMEMELRAIELGRELIQMSGDNDGLRLLMEEIVLNDSHHLDDLKRMGVVMPESPK